MKVPDFRTVDAQPPAVKHEIMEVPCEEGCGIRSSELDIIHTILEPMEHRNQNNLQLRILKQEA